MLSFYSAVNNLLGMLACEEAARRQRPVEHAEDFDPLEGLEVEQDVFTKYQRLTLTDFF